jgi:hypothetical protein
MSYMRSFLKTTITVCTGSILITACTSSPVPSDNDFIYRNINFGPDRDNDFKQGVRDACHTADGDYTKDHGMFKNNISYRVGWEDGRLNCKGEGDEVVQK